MLEFERLPIYWVNRLSAVARRDLAQTFQKAGHSVSPEEWAILMLLWGEDGQNPGKMAKRTVRDPTTMTRLIDSMVRKSFVVRRSDKRDRRRSLIFLTAAGRGLELKLVELATPMIEQSMLRISDQDVAVTMRVLKQMVENLSNK